MINKNKKFFIIFNKIKFLIKNIKMGDSDYNKLKEKFEKGITEISAEILENIEFSFSERKFVYLKDVRVWKDAIKQYIAEVCDPNNQKFKQLLKEMKQVLKINNKEEKMNIDINFDYPYNEKDKYDQYKDINFNHINRNINKNDIGNNINKSIRESNNVIMPNDIQNKLSVIMNEFKVISSDYVNDDDEIENKTLGEFLYKVANIARISYNNSNECLQKIYNKFEENNKNKESIIFSLDQFKEEFSTWVKNNYEEIQKNNIDKYSENINKYKTIIDEKDEKTKIYLIKLYKELLILYFFSELSVPSIEIDFNLYNNDFEHKKMYDIADNKGKKKVNFIVFPSLMSNCIYLDKGIKWVFTYKDNINKELFYFKEVKLEPLIDDNKKFKIPKLSDKLKLTMKRDKKLVPEINYKIFEKMKKIYYFHIINNKTKKERKIISESSINIDENEECLKCELFLMSEYILSYPDNMFN